MYFKILFIASLAIAGAHGEYQVTLEDTMAMFCNANGQSHYAATVRYKAVDVIPCIKNTVNMNSVIRMSKEDAIKTFCQKSTEIKWCIIDLMNAISPCINASQEFWIKTISNKIKDNLIDFACNDNGGNLVAFIRAGGEDCVKNQKEHINTLCIRVPPSDSPRTEAQQCELFTTITDCIAYQLGTCPNKRIKELFNLGLEIIKRDSPCNKQ